MLERVDQKTKNKLFNQTENIENLKNQTKIKGMKLEEESYAKTTLTNLIDRMREEILFIKKNISEKTNQNEKYRKEIEIHRFKETSIKEKVNQLHNTMLKKSQKNSLEFRENEYMAQYFNTVIDQKHAFLNLM